ncbi:AMP-binding protein [Mycolicibacterium sp. 120266]|uniref:AMP-binding protein n=1 Tax=Mycolicibacterium sp. 120266 TaxID=3090601 RepID=UPI00299F2C6F|nr:AMP-binding protein [Mycolicibacterium sp. 120266]MDX1873837.1 AMP-binding protein [Mycolicibacterium sp. 120266]
MDLSKHRGSPRPAVILDRSGAEVSFDTLDCDANRLARYLRGQGLQVGDTVAVLMDNCEHVHVVMWAARRAGLYYTMINTDLTASEIAYILADSVATAIIASASMRNLCDTLSREHCDAMPPVRLVADGDLDGWMRYPSCCSTESDAPMSSDREGQLLQYSAGTTGRPKGIRRPLRAPETGRSSLRTPVFDALEITQGSVYLSPAPIYHTAPAMWTMAAQSVGATTVLMQGFDAERALHLIERHAVTHAQFVPTMFVRMLRLPVDVRESYDISSLQRVVHAAAPCPPHIKRAMLDWWGPIIDEYYGSSEGAGVTFIRAEDWLTHPGSVGRPVLGRPHIVAESGVELPPGETGLVYFDGGYEFEYLNDTAATSAARSPEGWVSVGDVGHLDQDGYLYLTDRRHHMIISGGVNIYPREAENVLLEHPAVADVAVIGLPDADLGQRAVAVVELVDPFSAGVDLAGELMKWARARLGRHKCPRAVVFDRHLPRTDAGKLYKDRLVDRYSHNASW